MQVLFVKHCTTGTTVFFCQVAITRCVSAICSEVDIISSASWVGDTFQPCGYAWISSELHALCYEIFTSLTYRPINIPSVVTK